jgi:citrate synthase
MRGSIQYRNHSLDVLFNQNDFEDVTHLLIWGHLPNVDEKARFCKALAESSKPAQCVLDVIKSFPYVNCCEESASLLYLPKH